jgi:hypothetical protein
MAWKNCKYLKPEEREELLHRLFNCDSPGTATDGKRVFTELEQEQIMALIKNDFK